MGFPSAVERIIRSLVRPPCLHLFSGMSEIGDIRVDWNEDLKEPTHHMDVFDFLKTREAKREWEWVVLDPPYYRGRKKPYRRLPYPTGPSVPKRRKLCEFFRHYANNVLWLDYISPKIYGFKRNRVWIIYTCSWEHVRIFTWYKRLGRSLNHWLKLGCNV